MSKEALREIFRSEDPLCFHYPLGRGNSYSILEAEDNDYGILHILSPEDTRAQLVAPFDGTLFYNPLFERLYLCLSASTNLHFRSLFDNQEASPVNICWHFVDADSLVIAIHEIAVARNVDSYISEQEIGDFISGNSGVKVNSGDVIGNPLDNSFSMSYYEDDGTQINALYVLWKLKQYVIMDTFILEGVDRPSSESEPHPIESAIDSITEDFELSVSQEENLVVSDGGEFGLYRMMWIKEVL